MRDVWYPKNRVEALASALRIKRANREKVIRYYSKGAMSCACCNEREYQFLTLDHIRNDGAEHRKKDPLAKGSIVNWVIKNNFPPGLQVLCANCNMAKGWYGKCPHENKVVVNG